MNTNPECQFCVSELSDQNRADEIMSIFSLESCCSGLPWDSIQTELTDFNDTQGTATECSLSLPSEPPELDLSAFISGLRKAQAPAPEDSPNNLCESPSNFYESQNEEKCREEEGVVVLSTKSHRPNSQDQCLLLSPKKRSVMVLNSQDQCPVRSRKGHGILGPKCQNPDLVMSPKRARIKVTSSQPFKDSSLALDKQEISDIEDGSTTVGRENDASGSETEEEDSKEVNSTENKENIWPPYPRHLLNETHDADQRPKLSSLPTVTGVLRKPPSPCQNIPLNAKKQQGCSAKWVCPRTGKKFLKPPSRQLFIDNWLATKAKLP